MNDKLKSQRYFDQRIGGETVFVLPGHHLIQRGKTFPISTLLGSCVAACIRDTVTLSGGLNHFLLPEKTEMADGTQSSRYGVYAMEVLINELLNAGAKKENLEAKIFGGANVIQTSAKSPVGLQNGTFVKDYLKTEGIPILAEDLGGDCARRIYFYPHSGRVSVLRILSTMIDDVRKSEIELQEKTITSQGAGGVELF